MDHASLSDRLNQNCFCRRTDHDALQRVFAEASETPLLSSLMANRPGLFSELAVYLPLAAIDRMEAAAHAIEHVSELPAYRTRVLSHAPEIARFSPGPTGAFMGYDFHVVDDDPRLIEINTNAGGAFLNAALADAQRSCCTAAGLAAKAPLSGGFNAAVVRMFQAEWEKQGRVGQPGRVAIVDDDPPGQYLYPDMVLCQTALKHHGIDTVIADAGELVYDGGLLAHRGLTIDLVYNRLTDFDLDLPEHAALRAAYLAQAIVLTPNPAAHALFADKRNLASLSDPGQLRTLGATETDINVLAATVSRTAVVSDENASDLWAERRGLFFKPAGGFGSKAAYRGDKVTKTAWATILSGAYVAQDYMPPGTRHIRIEGTPTALKADIRMYRYSGETLLFAARLYQGQTTNFRTIGGGFAPVFVVD